MLLRRAGGQHACRVADALGMTTVFVHPHAGVLSAYGMGLADVAAMRERTVEATLDEAALTALEDTLDELAAVAAAELRTQGVAEDALRIERRAHVRYAGTDAPLVVPFGTLEEMRAGFEEAHRARFGFIAPDKALIVEAASVEAIGAADTGAGPAAVPGDGEPAVLARTRFYSEGAHHEAGVVARASMGPGRIVAGPAIIVEPHGTNVVEAGWQAEQTARGDLVLTRIAARPMRRALGTEADPVMLEIFNNLFMSIAEQMGVTLEHTAHSVNIKERRDFSCALFDPEGRLIANAPHMPVHLGSMGESVKTIIRERRADMGPGDVYMLNAPYTGARTCRTSP